LFLLFFIGEYGENHVIVLQSDGSIGKSVARISGVH